MTDPSDYLIALSPAGTVHVLKSDQPETRCGRTARLSDGWGYAKRFVGDWDGDFPPPYKHEAACTLCAHNYEQANN